jgi:hypothetical protein
VQPGTSQQPTNVLCVCVCVGGGGGWFGWVFSSEILDKVINRDGPPHRPMVPSSEAPAGVRHLMTRCWDEMSDARPSFDIIVKGMKDLTQ